MAYSVHNDTSHAAAGRFYEANQDQLWFWSPWHRVEVFNSLRQITRQQDPRTHISAAQAKALTIDLQDDVRCGYFTHREADWRDVLRTASELSLAHGFSLTFRSADLLHVAYAVEFSAKTFVSFDGRQLELVRAAGMRAIKPA